MASSRWTEQDLANLSKRNGPLRAQQAEGVKVAQVKYQKAVGIPFDPFLALLQSHGVPMPNPVTKYGPGREVIFARPRLWRADYHWEIPRKLIVEREGGLWADKDDDSKRAHAMPVNIRRDMHKSNAAQLLGYVYLRFESEDLDTGRAIEDIKRALAVAIA